MTNYRCDINEILNITKAVSDENRLRSLLFLGDGELCVCQIIEMIGLAPSTVSKHMSILKQAGLVDSRKSGRWIYYRLSSSPVASAIVELLTESLKADKVIAGDKKKLKKLMKIEKEQLCGCYVRKKEGEV